MAHKKYFIHNLKQEISLKRIFDSISMVEFVFICIAICYTGSFYLGKYS